jgi:hypothetical protein
LGCAHFNHASFVLASLEFLHLDGMELLIGVPGSRVSQEAWLKGVASTFL